MRVAVDWQFWEYRNSSDCKLLQCNQCERNSPAPQASSETETATTGTTAEPKPQFTRFLFLSKSAYVQPPAEGLYTQSGVGDSIVSELSKYVAELESMCHRRGGSEVKPLIFWKDRQAVYPNLRLIAEDLVAAPASQAFVEQIFSVCGLLSNGNRNRMSKSLEMRVCLKLNNNTLKHSGHNQFWCCWMLLTFDKVNNDNYCRYYLISDSHVISSSCLWTTCICSCRQ